MSDASGFSKMVPGFEFLQNLVKNAGSALPGIGQWVAPTLDPAELEKRIGELRTVQFWLEQNARMLATTIQALEVQKMTLSTLKTMNVQMGDLRESLKIKPAVADDADERPAEQAAVRKRSGKAAPPAVDPMQWWGALTSQFTQLATSAMKDSATDAAKTLAGNLLKQSFDNAAAGLKAAASTPAKVAGAAGAAALGAAAGAASATGKALRRPRATAKKRSVRKA